MNRLLLGLVLLPATLTSAETEPPPSNLKPAASEGRWILPAEGSAAEPVWGIQGGIAVGLWPTGGPRGLLRIYAPYLEQPRGRMVNFIAIEPIVGDKRGLSELEWSKLDQVQGKTMWTGDELDTDPSPRLPWRPVQGKIERRGESETMHFYVFVERFENGAQPIVKVELRQDRPHEVSLTTYSTRQGAKMKACVLTATMGNFARLRDLWLDGEVVRSTLLWKSVPPRDWGFLPARQWGLQRMLRTEGDVVVATTSDEPDPARINGPDTPRGWRYVGRPATQYWKTLAPPGRKDLVVRVNGRRTYWPDRTGSEGLIPGGIAYENFELEAPFVEGQEFRFGISPEKPDHLGFKLDWGNRVTDGGR